MGAPNPKEALKILLNKEWIPCVTRKHSPPLGWLPDIQETINHKEKLNYEIDISGIIFYDHQLMYSKDLIEQSNSFFEKQYTKNKTFFWEMAEKIDKVCTNMIKESKKINTSKSENIKKLIKIGHSNKVYWTVVVKFPDWLKDKLKTNIETPLKENYIIKYNKDLLKIINKIKKENPSKKINKGLIENNYQNLIKDFLEKYSWMGVFHMKGEEIELSYLIKEIENLKDINKTNFKEKEIKEESEDIRILRYFIYLRTYMAECQMFNEARIKRCMKLLAKEKKIPLSTMEYMTKEEILGVLENKKLNLKEITDRKNGYLLIRTNKEDVGIIDGKEYKKIKERMDEKLKSQKNPNINEIKGMIAHPGLIKGKAKIILNQSDFFKFEKGDILIAPSTTPNYIPIMAKAAAFVTDEGGIASHAAIVSREMNKPCIIATKIATKIFKDGDLIEVDANKGIVRKIYK